MYSEALRILELTEALEDSSRALEEERKARLEKDKEIDRKSVV